MTLENQLVLSYYREIGTLDERHGVKLVQHVESRRVFVMKTLNVYDLQVFRYLKDHPSSGVPRIEALVQDDGQLWVVEEYISGRSLRCILDEHGPMEPETAAKIMIRLCHILQPLHRQNPPIVNRDIKPENILLTADERLVLVDFNSAKESRSGSSRDTVLIGTAGYAAPEQYGFSPSKPSADIYALGVLLNELLTGFRPEVQRYTGDMEKVLEKCLQMEPDSRYQNVEQLEKALSPWRTGGSTAGRRDSLRQWLPPGLRSKNPVLLILGVLWYVLLVAISFMAEYEHCGSGLERFLNEVLAVLFFLLETMWLGNYRSWWSCMPLSRSRVLWQKLLGVALWAVVLGFALVLAGVSVLMAVFA